MKKSKKLAKAAPVSETLPPETDLEKIASEIENLPDEAAAVSMAKVALGNSAIARIQLGGVLLKMKQQGWFCGHHTLEEVTRDHFGIGKASAYEAMAIYFRVADSGLSAEAVRQIGIRKLGLLCSRAEQGKWTKAEFSARAEKAKAVSYLALLDSLKLVEKSATSPAPQIAPPVVSNPLAPEPVGKPQSATMALLKSVQPAADVDEPSAEEEADELSPEPTAVVAKDAMLSELKEQLRALMIKVGQSETLVVLELAFPSLEATITDTTPAVAAE